MSFFLGFSMKRISIIVVALLGLYVQKFMENYTNISFVKYFLMAACILSIFFVVVTAIWEFSLYMKHYRRYLRLKNDWNTETLQRFVIDILEKHYKKHLNNGTYYYALYRKMIDDATTWIENNKSH